MNDKQRQEVVQTITGETVGGFKTPKFTRVDDYTSFTAEYEVDGDDMVVHFFLPRDVDVPLDAATAGTTPAQIEEAAAVAAAIQRILSVNSWHRLYWTAQFPKALETAACEVFDAGPPRLQAAYTHEISSWWFKATGFPSLDPVALLHKFFAKLDQVLAPVGGDTVVPVRREMLKAK